MIDAGREFPGLAGARRPPLAPSAPAIMGPGQASAAPLPTEPGEITAAARRSGRHEIAEPAAAHHEGVIP
jgi:hypothetical protein